MCVIQAIVVFGNSSLCLRVYTSHFPIYWSGFCVDLSIVHRTWNNSICGFCCFETYSNTVPISTEQYSGTITQSLESGEL